MSDAPQIGLSYTGPARRVERAGKGREITISSTDRDRHGTIIDPAGARLDAYRENPVVLFGHDHTRIVGTSSVRLSEDGRRLIATMNRWAESAESVRQKVENGILKGASVGFRVLDKERTTDPEGNRVTVVTDWELVEWSWTPVPSNPGALARAGGEVRQLPEHAVRQLRAGPPATPRPAETTLRGADARRAMYGHRYRLRDVTTHRRGSSMTFHDRGR